MPPENQLKARVEFVYSYESFESDASKFWKKFGKKRNDELESFIGKRGSLDSVVAQIVSPGDTPEAKLLKIYARVQQLPNTSYQTQSAVLAKRHELLATDDIGAERNQKRKIENAEEIWRQGYGNSKQLNWLYVALTRAAASRPMACWFPNGATTSLLLRACKMANSMQRPFSPNLTARTCMWPRARPSLRSGCFLG